MGRSKNIEKASSLKILLEAYVKIIPCRKVTVETLSTQGKVLSTQKKENFSDPVLLNISQQEVTSDNVKDFTIIENDSLILDNLFQQYQKVSTKISVKCPFVEYSPAINSDSSVINNIIQTLTEDSKKLKTPTKSIEATIDVEILKNSECQPSSEDLTEVCKAITEVNNYESTLQGKDNAELQKSKNDSFLSEEVDLPAEENKNNNKNVEANVTISSSSPQKMKNGIATPLNKKTYEEPTPRRTSRRSSAQKLTLALEALKPKSKRNNSKLASNFEREVSLGEMQVENPITEIHKELPSKLLPLKSDSENLTSESKTWTEDLMLTEETIIDNSSTMTKESSPMTIDEEIMLMKTSNGDLNVVDSKNPKVTPESTSDKRPIRKSRILVSDKSTATIAEDVCEEDEDWNLDDPDFLPPENDSHDEFILETVPKRRKRDPISIVKDETDTESMEKPSPFRTLDTKCKICDAKVSIGGLTKHMNVHKGSSSNEKFNCAFCDKAFKNQYALDNHSESHQGQNKDGKFECPVCHKIYANKSALFKHRRAGPCSTEFKCSGCGISFSSEKSLHFHINQEHSALSKAPWRCTKCRKPFVTRGGLCRHKKLNQCRTDLFCQMCKKRFSKVAYFERHMLRHKEFVQKTHQCDLCGSLLGSVYSLAKHMSRHKSEKKHACPQCNKTFFDPSGLKVHMRSHSHEKPYICDICGKAFAQSGHLCRHKLQAHKIGKYPFVCTICGKGFVDRRNIDGHYKTHEKRNLRAEMKKNKTKKPKIVIPKAEPFDESDVVHITTEYSVADLMNSHLTQTNSDGSQTIISTNSPSIQQILQAADEQQSIEYITTQIDDGHVQVYDDHQTIINTEDMKVENVDVVYTIEDDVGAVESIPASDLGILAETAHQFQSSEGITYYIIKK